MAAKNEEELDLTKEFDAYNDVDEIKPVVKYDADSKSTITYVTEASSLLRNPSSINTVASS